ncbi:MAG: hypothetical protein R6U95_08315 [Bacteroidales bacterium]
MKQGILVLMCISLSFTQAQAQCFANPGNPVGGTANLGVMKHHMLRVSGLYLYSQSNTYFEGNTKYTGPKEVYSDAHYHYGQLVCAYGILPTLTIESETGYFFNKTSTYTINSLSQSGKGLSNTTVSLKTELYANQDSRTSVACALGASIPYKHDDIPNIDIRPSTGSYAGIFQTYIVRENSFKGTRIFYTNRIEKYFENDNNEIFGTSINQSLYYSRHFDLYERKLNDWTAIIQLKNSIEMQNKRNGDIIKASGGYSFWLVPQINLFVQKTWNISALCSIPIYQHLNDVQLGDSFNVGLQIIRDINFAE